MSDQTEASEQEPKPRKARKSVPRPNRTKLRVSLSYPEYEALEGVAARASLNVHALMLKVVREIIGAGPELLNDNVEALGAANAEAQAIGRNLNQLVRAVNTGKAKGVSVDKEYLGAVAARVEAMAKEIKLLAQRQRERWVSVGERG